MKRKGDYAGRLALSLLGVSEQTCDEIAASGKLPAELGEYTVLHRLHVLEAQLQTVMVMHQAIIAMSNVDMDKLDVTVRAVLDAQDRRGVKQPSPAAQGDDDD